MPQYLDDSGNPISTPTVYLDPNTGEPMKTAPALDLSNTKSEGLYQMRGPDGERTGVPYSKVSQAAKDGYQWASDSELQRYFKDNAADPNRTTNYAPTQAESTPEGHQAAVDAREDTAGPLGQLGIGVAKGAGTILRPLGDVIDTVSNNPNPPDDTARGALQTTGKVAGIASALVPAAISAPVATGVGLVGGAAGSYLGGKVGEAAGLGVHGQALSADVGGLAGGSAAGEMGEEAASALSGPAKELASHLVPSLVDGPPESLLTRAIKPGKNNVNWNTDILKAVPLMKSAEEQLGHPISGVDDALQAAQLAKKDIWQQYKTRLGPAAQMGATIDGNQIADAMVNTISDRMRTQNPALAQKVESLADTYRRPMTVDEAQEYLGGQQGVNAELQTYYAKNKVGRRAAEADPEMAAIVAEGDALRDALYNKLDQVSGPGAAQLKQAYGSLTNVEKELYGRQLVAARQNPESLSEQLSTVRGAAKIAKGVFTASPGDVIEGAQNIAVSKALKARNTSDAMIQRAFAKAQPATPFPAPASPRLAGLLQRGPLQTPPPGDASGSIPYQAPPVAATTRAQRLGLMLPANSSAPMVTPPPEYVPQMSGGEQLAALMQYLRQHPQLALPAKASAIPLPPG